VTTHNPACALVLTEGEASCNCIKPGPTKAQIDAEARRIHRCPEGYEGPCWGPNPEDRTQAHENLTRIPIPPLPRTES
jgi:hypothetical protein